MITCSLVLFRLIYTAFGIVPLIYLATSPAGAGTGALTVAAGFGEDGTTGDDVAGAGALIGWYWGEW